MKTKRAAFAAALAFAALTGAAALPAGAEIRVLACEPEWAALAEEIGGEDVTVDSATHGRQDAHYIRARPSLIAKVRRADIVFCSGAGLEVGWLPVLMQRGARDNVRPGQPGNIMAADHVRILEQPTVVDRSLGDVHPEGNPHVHLDPRNIDILAGVLAERLEIVEPERGDAFRQRLESFRARWADATADWRRRADALADMKIVVYHKAWVYFLNWSGLERVAVMERISGIPPTATQLVQVLEQVESGGGDAIIRAPFEPADAIEWLSDRTGIPILELPFTVGGHAEATDLFSLFDLTLSMLEGVDAGP